MVFYKIICIMIELLASHVEWNVLKTPSSINEMLTSYYSEILNFVCVIRFYTSIGKMFCVVSDRSYTLHVTKM